MGTDEDTARRCRLFLTDAFESVIVDDFETFVFQAADFGVVVDDVAQAVEMTIGVELSFSGGNGLDHSETESRIAVDFYLH